MNDTKSEITKHARRYIDEALKEYDLTDHASQDAIRQAVFRAIGYTEAAVISEAERRMEPNRAQELRRYFSNEPDSL